MTATLKGPYSWKATRDRDGSRTYKVKYLVLCDKLDGPQQATLAPGLPTVGSTYALDNDADLWAYCMPDLDVTPVVEGEPNEQFFVECTFSTRGMPRCNTSEVGDPLLEPQQVSGSFTRYSTEAVRDRFGNQLVNSAFEQLRGPQVEFDANRPSVKVVQNVASLGLATFSPMVDTVNAYTLWGLPPRTIKLSSASWERKYQGACTAYYTRTFEFDINYNTWDKVLLDEGTKALYGEWADVAGTAGGSYWKLKNIGGSPPNRFNPAHFVRVKDRNGENMRVILDGKGVPFDADNTTTGTGDDQVGLIYVQYYQESDFLLLGIPTSF